MGGKAFERHAPRIEIKRIPHALYDIVRRDIELKLHQVYHRVQAAAEAPEKDSHGDVDVLVTAPDDENQLAQGLASLSLTSNETLLDARPAHVQASYSRLSAQALRYDSRDPTYSLAVQTPCMTGALIQVDVRVCEPELFDWQLCMVSHGDLWNLLSHSLNLWGLVVSMDGLYLRDPDIESHDRKRGRQLLTVHADEALAFLGVDREAFWHPDGFATSEDMFQFIANAPFFRMEAYFEGLLNVNNARQRRRLAQRSHYRQFIEEWLPANRQRLQQRLEFGWPRSRDVKEAALNRWSQHEAWHARRFAWWQKTAMRPVLKEWGKEQRRQWREEQFEYGRAWTQYAETHSNEM